LLKAVLRHRPDRIIVGEVRSPEARTLLDAMNTGHRGTLATIHADNATEALDRMGTLAMRGDAHADAHRTSDEVQRSLDLVIHIARTEGKRFIREIHEVACKSGHI
jgi:Flp pilus assembly CpaF family ATPase